MIQIHEPVAIEPRDASAASWRLNAGTVDVWLLPVATGAGLEHQLQPQELAKANRFRNEESRAQYITSRIGLRMLSARYLDEEPSALVYAETGQHKPCWQAPHSGLHFNMAHSGNLVVLCFAEVETGVDLEANNERFNYREILPRCFTNQETISIENASDPRSCFYLYWTRKEALLKALGTGLHHEPATIPCLTGQHQKADIQKDWTIHSFLFEQNTIAVANEKRQTAGYTLQLFSYHLDAANDAS